LNDPTKKDTGTPRFATDHEIEVAEKRLLLSFAFKDEEEEETYKKEISYIKGIEKMIDKPIESSYKSLRSEL
jgi:hypothetical protein